MFLSLKNGGVLLDNTKGGLSYISWMKFLKEPGCPLCMARQQIVSSYIKTFLHEYVNDLTVRIEIDRNWGFCHEHAWEIKQVEENTYHDGMKNGIIYEYLTERLIEELQNYRERLEEPTPIKTKIFKRRVEAKARVRMLEALESKGQCPVCKHADLLEKIHANEFLRMIRLLWNGNDSAHVFCLKHLLLLLKQSENIEDSKYILDLELEKLKVLNIQLESYIKHHSYLHKHEPLGDEATSWIRAVALFARNR